MLTWLRNGSYLVSDDGNWMMTRRYKAGKPEHELFRSAGKGEWNRVRTAGDSQELKQAAEDMTRENAEARV